MQIISLTQHPTWLPAAVQYFWKHWGSESNFNFYQDCIRHSVDAAQELPQFYLGLKEEQIVASYALLTMMMAQVCGLEPGEFVHTFGDAHIYHNHFEQAELQLTRKPKTLPEMKINPEVTDLFAFTLEDFELVGYEADPHIKAPVAV